ncbi:MAG: hypothetical protein V1873_03445 [Verrucomicrobiota bacterium]
MTAQRRKLEIDLRWLRAWFDLTADERKFVAGILVIAVIGLAARYFHLKNQKAEPYQPEGVRQAEYGGRP